MAKIMSVNIIVSDDFEAGDCENCPLSTPASYYHYKCKLDYTNDSCPMYYHIPTWDEEYDFEITD